MAMDQEAHELKMLARDNDHIVTAPPYEVVQQQAQAVRLRLSRPAATGRVRWCVRGRSEQNSERVGSGGSGVQATPHHVVIAVCAVVGIVLLAVLVYFMLTCAKTGNQTHPGLTRADRATIGAPSPLHPPCHCPCPSLLPTPRPRRPPPKSHVGCALHSFSLHLVLWPSHSRCSRPPTPSPSPPPPAPPAAEPHPSRGTAGRLRSEGSGGKRREAQQPPLAHPRKGGGPH